MAGISSLSDLSDDLLRRVLFFAPAVEGATTAVLGRRWRTLWRSSGAVNLHWRCDGDDNRKQSQDFLRRAECALAAVHAEGTVRRLAIHVVVEYNHQTRSFLSGHGAAGYLIGSLLANPAVRRVEELSVAVHISGCTGGINESGGIYELNHGALPSEALRVLHINNCSNLGLGSPGAAFRWLSSMCLQGCTVLLAHLHKIIGTAPLLATLHLECCFLAGEGEGGAECYWFLNVTDLVLANCKWAGSAKGGMELDTPRLRYLRYVGFIGLVSFKFRPANLVRADLHFLDEFHRENDKMGNKMCVSFWRFLRNFVDAKVLKVKLNYLIEQIAVAEEKDLYGFLGSQLLCNLKSLEVEALHMRPTGKARTTAAIANLLHCCPNVCDLQLMLTTTTSRIPVIPFDDEDDDKYEVSDIPQLRKFSFNCLQSCLKRVRLRFQLEYVNCFEVQLAKFLAENALVLEEMYIEDRNYKVCEYINRRVRRWISDSSKRRSSSSAAAIAI